MALSTALRKKLSALAGSGVIVLSSVLLPELEGTRYQPYRDGGGLWTVCTGHAGPEVIPGTRYTQEQCDDFLAADIAIANRAVNRLVNVPMSEMQEAALTSFVFNVGSGQFSRSSLLKELNRGETNAACNSLLRWIYIGKAKSPGLLNRREIERELCLWGEE